MWYINIGQHQNKFWDLDTSNLNERLRSRLSSCASSTTIQVEKPATNSPQTAKSFRETDSDAVIDVTYQGNTGTFLAEVTESMLALFEGKDYASREKLEKLKLEINSSKLAYNINTDELGKNLFLAFLLLPKSNESFAQLTNVICFIIELIRIKNFIILI